MTKAGSGTHRHKPPKSPKAKYNERLKAERDTKKSEKPLPYKSVQELFKRE